MDRLTQRAGSMITYTGRHTKLPGMECAASMRVAATRDVMQRLADYEDTGLTPEQINNLLQESLQKKYGGPKNEYQDLSGKPGRKSDRPQVQPLPA